MPVNVAVWDHFGSDNCDGRVKTLVLYFHGCILVCRDVAEHVAHMAEHGIAPIDPAAVNGYPFEATRARGGASDAMSAL